MASLETAVPGSLVWGHAALAVCAVLYLAWWWIFFNPAVPKATGALYAAGAACLAGAVLFGVASIVLLARGLGGLSGASQGVVPGWTFAVGGVAAYFALAFVTVRLFHRPVTTELLLFVLWAALELSVVNALAGAGVLVPGAALGLAALVAAVFAGCLVCYVLYFQLAPLPSFIDGALPLAAVGITAAIMAVTAALA